MMAAFDAGKTVEKMTYDFSGFNGGKGEIPEPSTEQVAEYFAQLIGNLRSNSTRLRAVPEDETDEQRDERIRTEIIEGQHRSLETISRRRELLAELCSGQPSLEELCALPHRVLNAFEAFVLGCISPEVQSTATK